MSKKNKRQIEDMRDNLEFIDYNQPTETKQRGRTATIRYTLVRTANNRAFFTGTITEFTKKYLEFSTKNEAINKRQAIRYSARTGRPVFNGKVIAFVNEED